MLSGEVEATQALGLVWESIGLGLNGLFPLTMCAFVFFVELPGCTPRLRYKDCAFKAILFYRCFGNMQRVP